MKFPVPTLSILVPQKHKKVTLGRGEEMNLLHQTQMRPITLPHPLPCFLQLLCSLLLPAIQQPCYPMGRPTRRCQLTQLGAFLALHGEFPEEMPFYLNRLDRYSQLTGWRRENEFIEPALR